MPYARAYEHQRAVAVREAADDARAAADFPVKPFNHVVRADPPAVLGGELGQEVGRGLAYALAQAPGGRPEPPPLHLHGDLLGLGEGGFPALHGEHGPERASGPLGVRVAGPADDVAHEVHHAPLVPRPREHGAHRGDQARATVAHHQPDAPEAALDHASDELLPAGGILLHALGHSDDLAVAFGVHPDGDEHAHVLHRAAPRALVPHAVHEHVGVFAFQRPRAPRVDVGVHPLEFVGECLRGHPLAPQQLAGVVDLAGGDAR